MAKQRDKLSFTNAAEEILRRKGKPMHIREIVNECTKYNLLRTKGKTPEATMASALHNENKRKKEKRVKVRFERVGPAKWTVVE